MSQECMCRGVTSDTSIYSYIEVLLVGGVTHIFMHAFTFISVEVLLVGGVTKYTYILHILLLATVLQVTPRCMLLVTVYGVYICIDICYS